MDQVVTGERAVEPSGRGYDVKRRRLAYAPRQFLDLVDPEVEARFREVVRQLREAGAEVVEVDLGDDFGALTQTATWSIFFHETMGAISEFLRGYDIPTTFEAIYEGIKPELREVWGHMVLPGGGGAISAEAYQTALVVSRAEIQRRLDQAFVGHGAEAILQPTTPCTAPLIEQQASFHIAGREVKRGAVESPAFDAKQEVSLSGCAEIS